ncbi:hypothetical protein B0T26DRAFT_718293 [Lasiosphaeria miniovina]|uniref:Uncharacterized protein n=1 Tax=Lasiosphaeria miniovina TaxID=1954250 RepID=A0AA40DW06_9PEZI|nr:uncharacterized protein B0T26DRAFT_718293 [Lasiosphaeria miniovina]KAK0713763.1 hypothetical protein B0T26DRAFT_718293 [Lasiosphaeria miniovina]
MGRTRQASICRNHLPANDANHSATGIWNCPSPASSCFRPGVPRLWSSPPPSSCLGNTFP